MTDAAVHARLPRGLFISLEGLDGAGKSTQFRLLSQRLAAGGWEVVESVEPGGTRVARRIREVLLDPSTPELSPHTELLLYFAARAQNVDQLIRPALERGAIVLSDRFTDSTMAYQGIARGLGATLVRQLHDVACRGIQPDLTFLLDIPVETSAARMRGADRMESEPDEFRQLVRAGFLQIAAAEPRRVTVIDGGSAADVVAQRIWSEVGSRLGVGSGGAQ
jgi:dTMP kinase